MARAKTIPKYNFFLVRVSNISQPVISSPPRKGDLGWFYTPIKTRIHLYNDRGFSQNNIKKLLWENHQIDVSQSTISRTLNLKHNHKHRRGKSTGRPRLLTNRTVRYVAYLVRKGWRTRRWTFKRLIKEILPKDKQVNRATLRRALKRLGYTRCIACKRAFISHKQAL